MHKAQNNNNNKKTDNNLYALCALFNTFTHRTNSMKRRDAATWLEHSSSKQMHFHRFSAGTPHKNGSNGWSTRLSRLNVSLYIVFFTEFAAQQMRFNVTVLKNKSTSLGFCFNSIVCRFFLFLLYRSLSLSQFAFVYSCMVLIFTVLPFSPYSFHRPTIFWFIIRSLVIIINNNNLERMSQCWTVAVCPFPIPLLQFIRRRNVSFALIFGCGFVLIWVESFDFVKNNQIRTQKNTRTHTLSIVFQVGSWMANQWKRAFNRSP